MPTARSAGLRPAWPKPGGAVNVHELRPIHHVLLDRDPPERRDIPQGIPQRGFTAITAIGWANARSF